MTSLAEHIARTGMGVMDSGMGASKLGLSWGVLTGSEWMWRRQSAGASEWRPYSRDAGMVRRRGEFALGEDLYGEETYLFWTFPGALLNAELWSQPVITFMCLFFMFSLL